MAKIVYADNAATTPVSKEVLDAMMPYLTEGYGNASTLYRLGREARAALDTARAQVAEGIGALAEEIFFTGSGTEADNMALRGAMYAQKTRGHLITTPIEHHAVLHTARALEKEGFEVSYAPVDEYGTVILSELEKLIRPDTALVSVIAANNEIGTLQPIAEIGEMCRRRKVLFHTDAVQAVGHVPISVHEMNIDLLAMSAHKINGQKGVGVLFKRKGVAIRPIIEGGGQEKNLRSGTENIPGIVGCGEAVARAVSGLQEHTAKLRTLRERLIGGMLKIPYVRLTGHPENRLPGIASFVVECIEGESLILLLDRDGICASTGSACSTGALEPSHVLTAIGIPHEIVHGSIRLSLGVQNTREDVDYILEKITAIIEKLRAMSPLWEQKGKE